MKFLLALLLALPLAAQLQLLQLAGDSSQPVGPSVNLGTAAVRDTADFPFRVRNNGTASVALQNIGVSGVSFSLATAFTPLSLAPAQTFDFSVRFTPAGEGSYSASLTVNAISTVLRATAARGPSLMIANGSQTEELTGSSLQVNIAAGQSLTLSLSLGNPYAEPLTIDNLSVAGDGFALVNPPLSPLVLPPASTLPIPVSIAAAASAGEMAGVLTAGPRRFTILALVFRPQLAPPSILVSEALPRNGQQLKVRLRLPQPAAGPGTGLLRATFTADVDDPAVVFPNGAREIGFQVAAGSRNAVFDGDLETLIQTGTTAGTLRLDAITETGMTTETYRFDRAAVVVDTSSATRSGSNLEIDISGFDNTRGIGSLNFQFFNRAGAAIGGVITTTPSAEFKSYFESSKLGGLFRMRAVFPVSGDATMVGSVLVEIANAVGRTDLQRLTFP